MIEGIIIVALGISVIILGAWVINLQNTIRSMDYNQFMNSMSYELNNSSEQTEESSETKERILQ